MTAIIDSGVCNIASIMRALERVGAQFIVTTDAVQVAEASAVLLPGVGTFADGMAALHRNGLVEPLKAHAAKGRPLLGICLGMQLLADISEEFGEHQGLGLIPGRVRRLPNAPGHRVPNIGWCDMQVGSSARLFAGVESGASFYFVHSYVMECSDEADSIGTIKWDGSKVTVACQRGNIFGVQFHPEKSQDNGLAFLDRFAKLVISK